MKRMNLTQKQRKALIAALVTVLIACLAWAAWGGNLKSSRLANVSTAVSDRGFIVNIPQKALIKNYVTVSVEAPPGTTCELTYISPSGQTRQTDTTANTSGLCVWEWKINESEGRGEARLIFTIGNVNETHFMEILSNF